MADPTLSEIIQYHERTKHHFRRYARSPGYMDWQNQPHPFRFYKGKPPVSLPFMKQDPRAGSLDLYLRERNPPQPFDLGRIGAFLELSLGLSAWKSASGSQWSLRMNPSSGNLHPTEAHLVLPAIAGVKAGVYHYSPFLHALEPRAEIPIALWSRVVEHFGKEGFLVALTSIFWREAWKYGERAFRYCNHDVGHALACLSFSANLQGWKVTCLNAVSDAEIETVLGIDRTSWEEMEAEHPDLLCFVHRGHEGDVPRNLSAGIVENFSQLRFEGVPNTLSRERVNWEIIYKTASLLRKPVTAERTFPYRERPFYSGVAPSFSAAEIIRKRRSAVAYDGRASIARPQFLTILDRTLPRMGCAPFDAGIGDPCVHLLIFLHRVEGLDPGLYFFLRDDAAIGEIRDASDPGFLWQPVEAGLPLYLLKGGDFRGHATLLSCEQDIAGSSAFSLGMTARFREVLEGESYRYRHLFWETGMIGQVLYLEAEAQGLRGTGIGCFFDDAVHETLGLRSNAYQSLYHFTIGHPVEDRRLVTLPPYHHLKSTLL